MSASPGDQPGLLRAYWEQGRVAWPGIDLDEARFGAALDARVATADDPEAALAELEVADLYLTTACAAGLPAARAALEALLDDVPRWVRRVDTTPELHQAVRARLVSALVDGAGAPALDGYAGRGTLRDWLRVAATRVALELRGARRTPQPLVEAREGRDPDDPSGLDPELAHLGARMAPALPAALGEALASLEARARMLLRLHVAGLRPYALAGLYRVQLPTAVLWLQEARARLQAGVQARLRERLRLSTHELVGVGRLLAGRLELDLARLLSGDGA